MRTLRSIVFAALVLGANACAAQSSMPSPTSAAASVSTGELTGKVVWVDLKNASLLLECQDSDGCKAVGGKKGETYPVSIPAALKNTATSWKEGGLVKVTFEDRPDGGRIMKSGSTVQ